MNVHTLHFTDPLHWKMQQQSAADNIRVDLIARQYIGLKDKAYTTRTAQPLGRASHAVQLDISHHDRMAQEEFVLSLTVLPRS
jgi:hypothetical protein